MIVSAKRHFSSHSALRLGLQFDADWRGDTSTERGEYADTLRDSSNLDTDTEYQMFTIDLSYLNYPSPGSFINFFWGIGPLVKFSRSERNDTRTYYSDGPAMTQLTRDYSRSWSLGALGLVGVEWFLSEHFSFHSEYRASMAYGESYRERELIDSDSKWQRITRTNGDGWNFDSVYAILGLSVYF